MFKLLDKNSKSRLGARENDIDEIKAHPWFKEIDWGLLMEKKVK